ncbi:MAG: hypothetical protein WCB46_12390 [Methanoregula sp.]
MTSSESHGKFVSGVIVPGIMLVLVLLASGCTQQAASPVATTPPTEAGTVIPTAISTPARSTPGPTQTLKEEWSIEIQVESNGYAPDPKIVTTVRGGNGLNFIQQIDVRVTRSDGIVENGIIPKPLKVGDFVALNGTDKPGNYGDRAEVWATDPTGEKVKIFDDYVPFRTYN